MVLTKEKKVAKKAAKRLKKLQLAQETYRNQKIWELEQEILNQSKRKQQIDEKWRSMMLHAKEQIQKTDIFITMKQFDKAFDKKDFLIQHYIENIRQRDEQYQKNVSNFCDIFDQLLGRFFADMDVIKNQNCDVLSRILKKGEQEYEELKNMFMEFRTFELILLLYYKKLTAEEDIWTGRGLSMVALEDEKSKCKLQLNSKQASLEDSVRNNWEQIFSSIKEYITETSNVRKTIKIMKKKNSQESDIITRQSYQIMMSEMTIKKYKVELEAYESGNKHQRFRDRFNKYKEARLIWRTVLKEGCKLDDANIYELVQNSQDSLDWLSSAFKKAEKLLTIQEECRKHETLNEKVVPFGNIEPPVKILLLEDETDVSKVDQEATNDEEPSNDSNETQTSDVSAIIEQIKKNIDDCNLYKIWHRIAYAKLSQKSLLQEKEKLLRENQLLCRKLNEIELIKELENKNNKNCKENINVNYISIDGDIISLKKSNKNKKHYRGSEKSKKLKYKY